MKKKRITYGVYGMMEYQTIIRFGKNTLKVTFTGGGMNAIGVTPATFTTKNFLIQQAIENSDEFTHGRIRTVKFVELDEELRIERANPAPTITNQAKVPEITDEVKSKSDDEATSEIHPEEATQTGPTTHVEFSCNDDAKDFLEQSFGFVRSKLHNREAIVSAGASKGIEIVFI